MTSRRYVLTVAAVLYAFIGANVLLWHGYTGKIFVMKDMNRMATVITPDALTQDVHYAKHHTELMDYLASGSQESFDVMTIGDSFTNGLDGGSYPDYLVNQYGLKVINAKIRGHCLEDLYILLNIGVIDRIKPRAVILESVERSVQGRLGTLEINPQLYETSIEKLPALMRTKAAQEIASGLMPSVMIQWNGQFLYYLLYHMRHPDKLSTKVYTIQLDRPFFTNPGHENNLLHYWEDLEYLKHPLNAEIVNRNLNNAARLLKARGIKLLFFAAADKYDLYYPYITDKKHPENPFFAKMRAVQPKDYDFIDTLAVLREALARGEQDVYWLGDTHWSWKGIKLFCDELVKHSLN